MAVEKRVGTIAHWRELAPGLVTFQLMPQQGTSFPTYKAGQYIALTRENCKLTARGKDSTPPRYEPALDAAGAQKIGPVLLGMAKPAHILDNSATVRGIVNMAAYCVVDAQEQPRHSK